MTITTKEKGSRERLTGDKYFNLIEHAADGIAIIQDGVFKLVNTALCRIAGYDKQDLLGMPFTQLLTPASQKMTLARYQARLAGKKVPPIYEIQAVTKDGEIRDIEINAALAEYEGRIADEVIVRDITERKQMEQALADEATRRRILIDQSLDGIVVLDEDARVYEANQKFAEMLGYTPEEVRELHTWDWDKNFPPEKLLEMGRNVDEKGLHLETQHHRKDGSVIDVDISINGAVCAGKKLIFCVCRDITERKKAEEAIQQSNRRFTDIAENALEWIWEVDARGKYTYASPVVEKILGYKPEEVLGKHFYDLFHPDDREELKKAASEAFAQKQPFRQFVNRNIHKNGKIVWLSTSGVPILDEEGNLLGYRGADVDITEHKQAEEALRESEEEKNTIIEEAPVAICHTDLKGTIKYVNTRFEEESGYSRKEIIGKNALKLGWLSEGTLRYFMQRGAARLRGKPHKYWETQFKRKDGTWIWVTTEGKVIKKLGVPVGFQILASNITERKQAEEALRESQEFSSSLLENSPNPTLVTNPDTSVRYVNPAFEKLTGFTLAEITGRNAPYPWWPKEHREEMTATLKNAIVTGGRRSERVFQKKNGERFWAAVNSAPVLHDRKPIYFIINWLDITERKQAEQALADEATRRRILVDQSRDGIVILDENGKVYEANRQFADMLGYTPEEAAKLYVWDWEVLASREQILEMLKSVDEAGDHFETRHRRKDGTTIEVEISTNGAIFAGQKLIFCVCRDITERKQMEEALQAEKNKLQSVIGAMEYDLTIQDKDFNIIYQNEPSRISSGGDRLGEKCYRAYEGRDKICHGCPVRKAFKDGKSHTSERKRLSPSGEITFFENTANPIRDARGEIVSCLEIGRDITARKQMERQVQEKNEQLDAQNEELRAINEELRATEEELQQSQEKLERMFESVTDGIVVANLDGTILKVNEKAVQMHGFASEDEMLGKNAFELVAPVNHTRIASNIRKALKEGSIRDQEHTLLKADGSEFPGELSTSALKDTSGKVIGHITIVRDITERKQMEELFKTVTNSSPVGIYIMQDRKFQVANPQFQKLTGYTEDELLGMESLALVLDEDRDTVKEEAIKMLKGKRSSPYQFRVVNKSGETRWVMETVTSIQYRGRRATLGNYMDITERRQAEENEERLQQELNLTGRLASIGQLAAGVAHEINNPLTGVIGFSHLLLGRDIPDDMKQDLQVINSEAQRVSKIVENLLTFAHQRKTGREYVDINNIIARVLELRAYEMKVNNIEVETRLAPDLPHTMADAGQLQQVFLNIVLNAEHFMTTAHNRGKLLVKTERIDGNIRASFTDDGAGISQENLDKIFNPFFTTKEVGSGTGLGLSICHGIIAQHHGRIYAQSKLGQGATFVIELPIVEAPIPAERVEVTKKEPQKPRGAKILVVDDEAAILAFLHRLLTEWGHSVETLNNAKAALEKLKTERYSLILLDIKLPGMSGIELYQHIEEIAPALTRRVIFITGDVMEPATREFLDKAKVPHIIKPLGIEVLKKAINSALNQTQVAAGK